MLKIDIRNMVLKPKAGEIITVIGDVYTTVAEAIPNKGEGCEACAFNVSNLGFNSCYFVDCCLYDVIFKLIEIKKTKEVENE